MLSKKVKIKSRPQLEIANNQVRCSHGVSSGTLNEDQIAFLRSHGLSDNQAKWQLAKAFMMAPLSEMDLHSKIKLAAEKELLREANV